MSTTNNQSVDSLEQLPIIQQQVVESVDEKTKQKQLLQARIATLREQGFNEIATKLEKENHHILSPDVPLGAQEWLDKFITTDKSMLKVKHDVGLLANHEDTVLINGATGTGKEILANALHGDKSRDTFIGINCAGLPDGLIESELFGHVRGAFTGAADTQEGLFSKAGKGTVFLDEIGELPIGVQAKLLRVLQERSVRKVGSKCYENIHCRIICATHQDLSELVKARLFREDLLYRVNTFHVKVSSLSDRPTDIQPITNYYAQLIEASYYTKNKKPVTNPFPRDYVIKPTDVKEGNVRAIQAIVRRYHVLKELPQ